MGRLWRILKAAVSGFLANDALSRGAAIAFYAATSLAPVLLIVVAVAGLVFGHDAARGAISEELGQVLGPTGGEFIKSILERSRDPGSGTIATLLGIATVLITASGVFGEMHTALNATFKAKASDEPILTCGPEVHWFQVVQLVPRADWHDQDWVNSTALRWAI